MVNISGQLKNLNAASWRLWQLQEALAMIGHEKLAHTLHDVSKAINVNVDYIKEQLRKGGVRT